jgi:hypothetical protein
MVDKNQQQSKSSCSPSPSSYSESNCSDMEEEDDVEDPPKKPRRSARKGKGCNKPSNTKGKPSHKKKEPDACIGADEEKTTNNDVGINMDLPDQISNRAEISTTENAMVIDLLLDDQASDSDEENTTDVRDPAHQGNNKARSISADSHSTPQSASAESTQNNKMEAMEIIKQGGSTSSGLSSSEATNLLSAFLSLGQNERNTVLNLSHDDMVAEFQNIAKGNTRELKRREVHYTTSPKHKRLCC